MRVFDLNRIIVLMAAKHVAEVYVRAWSDNFALRLVISMSHLELKPIYYGFSNATIGFSAVS